MYEFLEKSFMTFSMSASLYGVLFKKDYHKVHQESTKITKYLYKVFVLSVKFFSRRAAENAKNADKILGF